MIVGYARVSTTDQSTDLQLRAFANQGIETVHQEKQSSIKKRPVLDALIQALKPGDVLAVYKLDRLARSMRHFVSLFDQLQKKQVGIKSLTEPIDTSTPQGRMFIQLLQVFAEFERELIRERCIAGQKAARARGQTWGRQPKITPEQSKKITAMWRSGVHQESLAISFGCSVACIRDHIHKTEGRGRWKNATHPTRDK